MTSPAHPSFSSLESPIAKTWKQNAVHTAIFEFFWGAGMPFCFPFAVLPLYFVALGRSRVFLQSVLVIIALLGVLQIWSGRWSHGARRHMRISLLWMLNGGVWLLYGLLAFALLDRLGPTFLAALLAASLMLGSLAFYLANPAYYELLVDNIPLPRRGAMAAIRILANGTAALLAVPLASFLMQAVPTPENFHWRFAIGGVLMMGGSVWFFAFFRDAAVSTAAETPPPAPLSTVRRLLRCPPFRRFLIGHMVLASAQSLAPLLVAAAKDRLQFPPNEMEHFVLFFFLGIAILGPLIAWLADRIGFRRVAVLNSTLLALAFLAAAWILFRPSGHGPTLLGAYGIYGASILLGTVVLSHFGSELIPEVRPSFFFATAVVLAGPCSLLAAPLAGAIVDTGNAFAYPLVFAGGAILALMAALVFGRWVPEPRSPYCIRPERTPATPDTPRSCT